MGMEVSLNPLCQRLRICFIGYMAGAKGGFTTSQGLVLARMIENQGWPVATVSRFHNRWLRLGETLLVLIRDSGNISLAVLEVYGGRGFLLADVVSAVAGMLRLPVVMVLHGGSIPEMIRDSPAWTRRVLSRARAIVAPTHYQARAVGLLSGLSATIIPNVLPLEDYPHTVRRSVRPRLFWMRNFHPIYNPIMAIRVLQRLRPLYPDAELVMAGRDDENCDRIRREAESAGLTTAISFPGFLDLNGKLQAASNCDIFVNTNHIDNSPVAIVEACALGLPVVSTAVGGVPDLLSHGETGLLIPDDDDAAMAEAIISLVESPALASRLSSNGRQVAEECAATRVVPCWTGLFKGVLGQMG